MRRRAAPGAGSLTSMIDVLFILVFASLAYAQSKPEAAEAEPRDREPIEVARPDAGVAAAPDAARAPAEHREIQARAVDRAMETLQGGGVIVLRVSATGELFAIETSPGDRLDIGVPLLERVAGDDINLAYLGDRSADLQLCAVAQRYRSVDGHLVAVAPERPLADLPFNLVEGIRRDLDRCRRLGGLAVIVEPDPEVRDE